MTRKTFKVGDRVKWSSQSAGIHKQKRGEIIEVVPTHALPVARAIGWSVMPRNHESYVVKVKGKGLYWPRVIHLEADDGATQN